MTDRTGIFGGDDPFDITREWLAAAKKAEPNDPNAMALATVDDTGMPNNRIVLLKEIEESSFIFYTNYNSAKGQELTATPKAAFVMHWKSLRRQIRARGAIAKVEGKQADAYFDSRSLLSRLGARASRQSEVIANRGVLEQRVEDVKLEYSDAPRRPEFWGGFRLIPSEIEFWCDGEGRLHDRFRWIKNGNEWKIDRLSP